MQNDSGSTISVWMETTDSPPLLSPIKEDMRANVCVVGAGIAGLTTAYLLAREGKRVVVLDDGPIGGGMTGRTTAHLSNAIDDRYVEIERLFTERGARLAAESHTAAIERIESIVKEEKIDCDFERLDGYLFAPPRGSKKLLEDELKAAHRAGLVEVELVERAPLADFDTGAALRFPNQGQFHPLKYLNGLARAIERDGGHIFTGTHATSIEGGFTARIETSVGPVVTADAVVVATNTPVNDLVAIHTKQAPYLTYVIGARLPRGSVTRALYWDTLDPYHYVRLQSLPAEEARGSKRRGKAKEYDLLIVGGEDHKTGQADDANRRFSTLERWARRRFPEMEEIEFRWSGQVMETIDGLAFIGRNPMDAANVLIATGDSGMGMTHGTIAGLLLTDLILERENPWTSLYSPSRLILGAAGEFAKENLNVLSQYTDWFKTGEVDSADEIKRGEGAVLRSGLTKIAAYRDEDGTLHENSAICRHLGCIVHWNSKEKTWDCPCHGSRYDPRGHVLQGPANTDLEPQPSGSKE
ncbi:MAG TPA: FAD-dependent oxidoreductase [Pyrinomonadaceae bacterium]